MAHGATFWFEPPLVHGLLCEACRARLDRGMWEMRDPAEEPEAQYDSDMAVYLGAGNPAVERNIATMKRLAAEEGKATVTEQQR